MRIEQFFSKFSFLSISSFFIGFYSYALSVNDTIETAPMFASGYKNVIDKVQNIFEGYKKCLALNFLLALQNFYLHFESAEQILRFECSAFESLVVGSVFIAGLDLVLCELSSKQFATVFNVLFFQICDSVALRFWTLKLFI